MGAPLIKAWSRLPKFKCKLPFPLEDDGIKGYFLIWPQHGLQIHTMLIFSAIFKFFEQ